MPTSRDERRLFDGTCAPMFDLQRRTMQTHAGRGWRTAGRQFQLEPAYCGKGENGEARQLAFGNLLLPPAKPSALLLTHAAPSQRGPGEGVRHTLHAARCVLSATARGRMGIVPYPLSCLAAWHRPIRDLRPPDQQGQGWSEHGERGTHPRLPACRPPAGSSRPADLWCSSSPGASPKHLPPRSSFSAISLALSCFAVGTVTLEDPYPGCLTSFASRDAHPAAEEVAWGGLSWRALALPIQHAQPARGVEFRARNQEPRRDASSSAFRHRGASLRRSHAIAPGFLDDASPSPVKILGPQQRCAADSRVLSLAPS